MKLLYLVLLGSFIILFPNAYADTFSDTPSNEDSNVASDMTPAECNGKTVSGVGGVVRASTDSTICRVPWQTFDISEIPTNAILLNATYTYDVTATDVTTTSCYLFDYATEPSAGQASYNAVFTATGIATANTGCQTVTDNKIFVMNATGLAKIQENISSGEGFYALGIWFVTEPVTESIIIRSSDSILELTYLTFDAPDAITDLTLDSVTHSTATVSFTPPNLNGETLQSYSFYLDTPQTNNVLSFFSNSTDNPVTLSDLDSNTEYSLNATAVTLGGRNFTGMNILNFTTNIDAPTNLVAINIFSLNEIILTWDDDNLNTEGYKIERESPVNGGFVTIVNNTGNALKSYTDTVSDDTTYNYRVSAIVNSDSSAPSNEYSITTTPDIPDLTNIDMTELELVWSNIGANPVILDTNSDGIIDNIYTRSNNATHYIFTKVIGTGLSSVAIDNNNVGGSVKIKVYEDEIWLGVGQTNNATVSIINILTNESQPNVHTQALDRGHDAIFDFFKGYQYGNVTIGVIGGTVSIALCGGNIYCADLEVSTPTTTLADSACNSANTNGLADMDGSKEFLSLSSVSTGGCNLSYSVDKNYGTPSGIELSGTNSGWCSGTSCQTDENDNIVNISPGLTFADISQSYTIRWFGNGFELPYGDEINTHNDLWIDYLTDIETEPKKILNTHYKILDPDLTNSVPFALFYDGDYKIIQLNNTIRYADLPNYQNRTVSFNLFDDYTGADYSTLDSTSLVQSYLPYISTENNVYSSVNTTGAFGLISGYEITPDDTTTQRRIVSNYNSNEFVPSFLGITSGLTELSILVRNAPDNFALLVYDTNELDDIRYLWSTQELQADNTITVDLPSGLCVDIVGITFNTNTPETNEFGSLCASGTMPKTIIYSDNLSFTFWSLPYGVSHTFTQDSSTLTTKVRHDTAPFEYTVELYDSDGVLQYDNTFMSNSTEIDLQTINATGISLPALLKVFDEDDNQIYYSTIGTPGYFSSTVSWFAQYLTIDGFNLLFMLPLVFGAMFTRNTVSVGTIITVVFIATLTWLGIIPLPDIVIYLMIFIGIIGMIAYKRIYD